jgi:hypothetical protein
MNFKVAAFLGFCLTSAACSDAAETETAASTAAAASTLPAFRTAGMSQIPATIPYAVNDFDANNCEFFVNAFGRGTFSHNSGFANWIEAYVSIDEASLVLGAKGSIENVGMYVKYSGLNAASASGDGLFLGNRIEPAYYKVRMTNSENVHGNGITQVRRRVERLAFFIDVKRANGVVDRLWLKNGAADYTVDAIFDGYPVSYQNLGAGLVTFAEGGSPIFNQKRACGH